MTTEAGDGSVVYATKEVNGKTVFAKDFVYYVKEVPVSYTGTGENKVGYQSGGEEYRVTVTMELKETNAGGNTGAGGAAGAAASGSSGMQLVQTGTKIEKKDSSVAGGWMDVTSGGMVFTNEYKAKGETTISVRKMLTGTALQKDKFTFSLEGLNAPAGYTTLTVNNTAGTAVDGAENTYQSVTSFPKLTYTMEDM